MATPLIGAACDAPQRLPLIERSPKAGRMGSRVPPEGGDANAGASARPIDLACEFFLTFPRRVKASRRFCDLTFAPNAANRPSPCFGAGGARRRRDVRRVRSAPAGRACSHTGERRRGAVAKSVRMGGA
jgi:hypothetical protein